MRRPISAMTAATLVFALCPGLIRAQNAGQDVGQPPAREDSSASPAVFDPMASARGARHLLRNGQDYISYEQFDRALSFLREAETRQAELSVAERQQLKQALERAQRGLRQPANTKKGRYAKSRTTRAGSIASATAGQGQNQGAASPSGFQLTSGTQAIEAPAAAAPAPAPSRLPAVSTPEPAPAPAPLPADAPYVPAPEAAAPVPAAEPAPLELPAPTPSQALAPAPPEPAPLALPTAAPAPAQAEPAPLALPEPSSPEPAVPQPAPAAEPVAAMPSPEPTSTMPTPAAAMPSPSAEPAMNFPAPEAEPAAAMPAPDAPAFPPAAEAIAPTVSAEPSLPQLPDAEVAVRPEMTPDVRPIGVPASIADLPPAAPAEELGLPPLPADAAPAPAGRPAMASPESAAPRAAMVAQDPSEGGRPTVGGLAASEADPVPVPAAEATQLPDAPPQSTSVPALTDTPPAPAASAGVPDDRSDVPAHLRHLLPRRDVTPFQSSLSPGSLRAVEEIARRQDDAMKQAEPAAPAPGSYGSANVTSPRLELSRAPSPAEPRPIRAIPVPEDFVPMAARQWGPRRKYWSAAAVCSMPLYFQDASLERYGHSAEQFFGPTGRHLSYPLDDVTQSKQRNQIIQPFFSAGLFAAQIAFLPYNMLMDPPWEAQYDLGYYRPNDKIPTDTYYLPLTGIGPPLHGKNY
ncbi:hypothetical protein EP7_000031 [Isosphaeraceae bacterium EP7]